MRNPPPPPVISELDEGIREIVAILYLDGFNPVDSGDGSKSGSMEGALEFRHVFMVVDPEDLLREADRLNQLALRLGPPWTVEATYKPADKSAPAILALYEVKE